MNLQMSIIVFKFFRELFFDRKEEADFRSKYFKPKRWVAFLLTIWCFMYSGFISYRVFRIAQEYEAARIGCQHITDKPAIKKPIDKKSLENTK